jgi:hypothetical protein
MQDTTQGNVSCTNIGHHADSTQNLENQALVTKVMDNTRECALKFEAAKQIIVDHDDVERKNLLKLGDKPDISNSVLEYILNGAIWESSTRRECMHGEAITHLRKAYTTVKEQGHETYGGLSGAIMQPVQVMWQDTFMRHLMTM